MKIKQNKMMGYLAVTAGVGCVSSAANAAVVFYGNASNTNIQTDPAGVNIGYSYGSGFSVDWTNGASSIFFNGAGDKLFSGGADLPARSGGFYGGVSFNTRGTFFYGGFKNGAVAGNQNYANISFNGNDGVYEAVAQFYFNGGSGSYLMAIATTNPIPNPQNLSAVGGPALSISAGKAMIDAAAVPEPTSFGLLALGAMGLATRRQRRKAA